ncbi:uncharacterized protein FIBRA_09094 [Fibroporia radiculosa]|uniref:RTA1 like protein n=1 Tax=Fibroporia radiculosa TaxID=599839 RepID=J4H5I4_9APHY|nr:uncharacterized protein FIBRA_09094 [Fibroporia radiculosa]CCM06794.1 predicted protein [Fibroporia radiculosa]
MAGEKVHAGHWPRELVFNSTSSFSACTVLSTKTKTSEARAGNAVRAKVKSHESSSPYGYVPTEWICVLFVALFSLSTAMHTAQAARTRLWWLLPTACCAGVLEIVGWSVSCAVRRPVRAVLTARFLGLSPSSPLPGGLRRIVATIIAPTPLIAVNFVVLAELIRRLGPCYSRLSQRRYTLIFCGCDVVSLVVQAVGGGLASAAVNEDESPNQGGYIMLGGIAFQMFSITVYMLLAMEFVSRFLHDRPVRIAAEGPRTGLDTKARLMFAGLALSSLCIYVRSVYRTIELADGWTGYIIETQRYFDWLDGGMVALAMFAINVFHPGRLLGPRSTWGAAVACTADTVQYSASGKGKTMQDGEEEDEDEGGLM